MYNKVVFDNGMVSVNGEKDFYGIFIGNDMELHILPKNHFDEKYCSGLKEYYQNILNPLDTNSYLEILYNSCEYILHSTDNRGFYDSITLCGFDRKKYCWHLYEDLISAYGIFEDFAETAV